jgi:serine/threonine-protein kinase
MDATVAQLVREERLVEAAGLAAELGDHKNASLLYERACDWSTAAREAERDGDLSRALVLARHARDDELGRRLLPAVASDKVLALRVAGALADRGDVLFAARLFDAADAAAEAAPRYERAGEPGRAAELYEETGDVAAAARTLEGALRKDAEQHSLRIQLGELLVRYNKLDSAMRVLQLVPSGAFERRAAVTLMLTALRGLGLTRGEDELEAELSTLGGPASILPKPRTPQAQAPRLFGRYEVKSEIASTPTARVIHCVDVVRQEEVAVKVFAGYDARGTGRDALRRFEREMRVLGTMNHPNIVPLKDYIEEGPAIVMGWMAGGTLADLMAREPISPRRCIEIADVVLLALSEAHRLGVLHRDIKPANVLFDLGGTAKLADFGVAHLGDLSATATAGVIGTLGYMSPEQREGAPATVQSDIYGVGALLLEMLTGEAPSWRLDGSTERDVARPSSAHRDLGEAHDAAVLALVAALPNDRPGDALRARTMLRALTWPNVIDRVTVRRMSERASRSVLEDARFREEGEGHALDTWLERSVQTLPLSPQLQVRAAQYTAACHPALQGVWGVHTLGTESFILLQAAHGQPLARLGRPLNQKELTWLGQALEALGQSGFVHGAIDADTVWIDELRGPMLLFSPQAASSASIDQDRMALAALSRR